MLELLRNKQGPLWIVIAVVVIISFVFFGNPIQPSTGEVRLEDRAFTIYGKSHSFAEFEKLRRLNALASRLGLEVPGLRPQGFPSTFDGVVATIAQQFHFGDEIQPDFAFNMIVLRKELQNHGIHVSDDEAREAFRNLPMFKNDKGEFDAARAEFIQARMQEEMGSLGLRLTDVYELLRDWIGLNKLVELVASNASASDHLAQVFYAQRHQNISVATIPFAFETFKKGIQVTDEEISKYFEEHKENFKSSEKRAISYVFFPTPNTEKLSEEESQKALNANVEKINAFAEAIIAPNASLEEEAKKAGVELKKIPAFSLLEAPEDLKEEFLVLREVFQNDPETRPISDPIEGSKGHYVFSVTEVQQPKPQTLDEVKDNIKETLISQKTNEAITKAANETRKKVEELIKGGKSFDDACKEAGITAHKQPEFSPDNPPTNLSNGQSIAVASAFTAPGSFTREPVSAETGLLLVYVLNKELYKRDSAVQDKNAVRSAIDGFTQYGVFRAWFERRREEAKLNADPIIQRALRAQADSAA